MNKYWANRLAKAQEAITLKNTKQLEKQLAKYYSSTMKKVSADFEATYDKYLATLEDGKQPTANQLYQMDKYWKMQGQLRQEIEKLGRKQEAAMSKIFELNYFEVYHSLNLDSFSSFTTISKDMAKHMINSIWVADGKTFSQRIWNNTSRLLETLNEGLINTVVAGKKTSELKKALMERFNVSYRRADTLVRTELCHIQTQAAQQRYKDYGIQYVEVLVDPDARTCDKCKALIGKKFRIDETPPLPVHPNERCTLIAVIEENNERKEETMEDNRQNKLKAIEENYPEMKEYLQQRKARFSHWEDKLHELKKGWAVNLDNYRIKNKPTTVEEQEAWIKKHLKELHEREEDELINSFIFCADCGKPIPADGKKTNAIKRCPECQAKYRKKYKAQKEKERRAKKKN